MRLYTKEAIEHMALEKWKRVAFEKFEQKIADKHKPFPCIPATQGHQLHHFRYGFVSNSNSNDSSEELAQLLQEYSKSFRKLGNYTSLIVFYEPCSQFSEQMAIEEYEQHFWTQLTKISEQDSIQWPRHIPQDPHDPLWEFCFHGEQYFMYCATPAHKNRLSRSFPYFMLAITPRWVLEEFYSSASHASKIKTNIRKRLQAYDSVPIHSDLNTYGLEDNYEWKQYFLHDDDSSLKECPFHKNEKTSKD